MAGQSNFTANEYQKERREIADKSVRYSGKVISSIIYSMNKEGQLFAEKVLTRSSLTLFIQKRIF